MYILIPVRVFTENVKGRTIPGIQCPNCAQHTDYSLIKQVNGATVMFIPIYYVISAAFAVCQTCGATFPIGKKGYKQLRRAHKVTTEDFFACVYAAVDAQKRTEQRHREKQWNIVKAGFSNKKQAVAALLALFLKPFGAHHFYLGQNRLGLLCLGINSVLMVVESMYSFSIMFGVLNVFIIWGIVDAVRIWLGLYKDKEGRYVVSEKQRQSLLLYGVPPAQSNKATEEHKPGYQRQDEKNGDSKSVAINRKIRGARLVYLILAIFFGIGVCCAAVMLIASLSGADLGEVPITFLLIFYTVAMALFIWLFVRGRNS